MKSTPEVSKIWGWRTVGWQRDQGDSGYTFLTVFIVAMVGQWHGVHGTSEAWHGWGRGSGARRVQLAELASEVRGTEAAVRLHAHAAVVTDQWTQDWGGEKVKTFEGALRLADTPEAIASKLAQTATL